MLFLLTFSVLSTGCIYRVVYGPRVYDIYGQDTPAAARIRFYQQHPEFKDDVIDDGITGIVPGPNGWIISHHKKDASPAVPRPQSLKPAVKAREWVNVPDGYFQPPLDGPIEINWKKGLHGKGNTGYDLFAKKGSRVKSSAAGKVIVASTGWNDGSGYLIRILHPNGTITAYCHLSQIDVWKGQEVFQGQTIGLSGNSGNVSSDCGGDGSHLHFAVYYTENPAPKWESRYASR